jgi:hypothetical protein
MEHTARNLVANKKFFGAVALLFVIATVFNSAKSGEFGYAGPQMVAPERLKQLSGPTLPPGPWDEGKYSPGVTTAAAKRI